MNDFKEGDRVQLVKKFRMGLEQTEEDRVYGRGLNPRATGTVLSVDTGDNTILVQWDNYDDLWTHVDTLAFELPPATEREVSDAIRSILGVTGPDEQWNQDQEDQTIGPNDY